MQRANDIAHYMLTHDIPVTVSDGKTANGVPFTVIMAVGEYAPLARQVGERLLREIARRAAEDSLRADRN